MKFIYSLMFITFLMTTFTSETGWGGSAECRGKRNAAYAACDRGDLACTGRADRAYSLCNSGSSAAPVKTSAPVTAVKQAPKKSNSTTTPTKKNTAVKTPAASKAVSETQQVNVPASNTFHCNSANYKSGPCYCEKGETKETVSGNSLNATVSKCNAKTEDLINPSKPDPENIPQHSQFTCLNPYEYYVSDCQQKATSAVGKCDTESEENKSNSDLAGLGDLLKGANAAAVQGKAGSGAYEACLNTALTTQAGFFASEKLNSTVCEPAINQCKTSCSDVREQLVSNRAYILQNCENDAISEYLTEYGSFDSEEEKQKYIRNYHSNLEPEIIKEYEGIVGRLEQAEDDCGVDAVSLQNKLKQASNDFNNAAKQAQVCRCQTGSTGEDCSAIQGPAQCVLNPSAPGCALSTVNCNNSNSVQCQCLRNPNLAVCKSGNSKVSALAGQPFSTPSSSIGSGVAPKMNNGDFDISFADDALNAGASGTTGSATSPFGSAEASGGGGGGGSGAGAGTGEGDPAAAVDGEGGLKHLLDKAKGFVGNSFGKIFGDKNPMDKKYKTDANGKKIDPSKWKPGMIRGVAGNGSEIGPKHRDIWKAMNSQYFLQEKTFIDGK